MKKKILMLLSILILSSTVCMAARPAVNSELSSAIRMYKAGNYSECYVKLETIIKKDPANALAYYYRAMTSAQLGKKDEAIKNYEKAITLAPANSNLSRYATKGKTCLETPDKCAESLYESKDDEFILNRNRQYTESVESTMDKLKIENMMREINRNEDMDPQKFKQYRDFSSMNNETPTNDEIVAALKTLQKAGLGNLFNNNYSDLSLLTGDNKSEAAAMMNLMGTSSMSPQMIQALLTNNMSLGY